MHRAVDQGHKILALECLLSRELVMLFLILPQAVTPHKDGVTPDMTKGSYTSPLSGGT